MMNLDANYAPGVVVLHRVPPSRSFSRRFIRWNLRQIKAPSDLLSRILIVKVTVDDDEISAILRFTVMELKIFSVRIFLSRERKRQGVRLK